MSMLTLAGIADFQRDGACVLRGLPEGWAAVMAAGVACNMADPGPCASENAVTLGRFFDDHCNWTRIPDYERLIRESPAADIAAQAMQSPTAQFLHHHLLVKEPGRPKPTPWHADGPYHFVTGTQGMAAGQRLRSDWFPVIREPDVAGPGA